MYKLAFIITLMTGSCWAAQNQISQKSTAALQAAAQFEIKTTQALAGATVFGLVSLFALNKLPYLRKSKTILALEGFCLAVIIYALWARSHAKNWTRAAQDLQTEIKKLEARFEELQKQAAETDLRNSTQPPSAPANGVADPTKNTQARTQTRKDTLLEKQRVLGLYGLYGSPLSD